MTQWMNESTAAPAEVILTTAFQLDAKWAERFRAETPAGTFRLRVLVGHPQVAAEVRLLEGDDRIGSGGRLRVLRYGDQAPARRDQRGQKNLYVLYSHLGGKGMFDFYQVDRVRGTATWTYSGQAAGRLLTMGLFPVSFDWQFVAMPYPRVWRTDKWVDMPAWLEDRTLAVIAFPPDGGFDREITVEHLPLKP